MGKPKNGFQGPENQSKTISFTNNEKKGIVWNGVCVRVLRL